MVKKLNVRIQSEYMRTKYPKKISLDESEHMLSIENRIECAMVNGIQLL